MKFLKYSLVLVAFLFFKTSFAQFEFIKDYLFFHPGKDVKKHVIAKGGYGVPYGFLGANIEVGSNHLSMVIGNGYSLIKNVQGTYAFNLGLRYYPFDFTKKIRPRVGVHYGTNYVYAVDNGSKSSIGLSIGIGYEHQISDIIYYDLDYTILINSLSNYRPVQRDIESVAVPSIGIGILLFSNHK